MTILIPYMVYVINGTAGFRQSLIQMVIIAMIANIFDRIFIDWWWVGKTRAWIIPGTEEFMPYIYGKTLVTKWVGTLIGFPVLAALIAGILTLLKWI